jgi:hypothetical protein
VIAVHELAEDLLALHARIVALDEQPVEQSLLLARDLVGRIRRRRQRLGGELDEQLPVARCDLAGQAARVAGEAAGGRLEQRRELLLGVARRALVDEAAGEERRAFVTARIERVSAAHVRVQREHRHAGATRDEQDCAAGELAALDRQLDGRQPGAHRLARRLDLRRCAATFAAVAGWHQPTTRRSGRR